MGERITFEIVTPAELAAAEARLQAQIDALGRSDEAAAAVLETLLERAHTHATTPPPVEPPPTTGLESSEPARIHGQPGATISGRRFDRRPAATQIEIFDSAGAQVIGCDVGHVDAQVETARGIHVRNSPGTVVSRSAVTTGRRKPAGQTWERYTAILIENSSNCIIDDSLLYDSESLIEIKGASHGCYVRRNGLLHPLGNMPRGQSVQVQLSNGTTIAGNYMQHPPPELGRGEDHVNLWRSDDALVEDNFMVGGYSGSGGGIISDEFADRIRAVRNVMVETANAGIGFADGNGHEAIENVVYNTVAIGGGSAYYAYDQYQPIGGGTAVFRNNIGVSANGGGITRLAGFAAGDVIVENHLSGAVGRQAALNFLRQYQPPPLPDLPFTPQHTPPALRDWRSELPAA